MQKKKIISTYLSLANYIADTIAIEINKNYKNLKIKSYKKISPYQVVTKLDLKIEKIVRKLIHSKFPEHNIIGEELGNINNNSDFTWIIDPIDGTKAFISGIPVFSFLLSLKYRNDYLEQRLYFDNNFKESARWTDTPENDSIINDVFAFVNPSFM